MRPLTQQLIRLKKIKKMLTLINHLAVKNIADICNQLECWLIHVSTDYVFDGKSKVPYKEDDQTTLRVRMEKPSLRVS